MLHGSGWVVNTMPLLLYPGKTLGAYHIGRRLGGSHGPSGWVQKISPKMGFDPQAVQPVLSKLFWPLNHSMLNKKKV